MDEVNHVKMVVSFVCYLVVLVISLLHDGYECNINLFIGERLLKYFILQTS